ncbi:molybdenum cofactor guanylyltransferase [Haloarcula onubensis]|uniref:Probable molybdenum cofactor guanylyltransferase n=1 Tax=Haloarcula onubensis TaxID=2950539 RepID=A0ABU2FM13_9EURY|nr:molybdenum cofactor guanylyltransferase [Halomicroarcula sp. S3CR25-11]MDS0281449.1 molybdenum cofactor guanylyltransferase [Halomicroarcula sp. S3CR25-11]
MPTDEHSTATGVVVAGGRSTRFGDREKALADLDGRPLLAHVAATLAELADTVVVNCRPDQRPDFVDALSGLDADIAWALDERPDEGPLAGLATALAAVGTDHAVVLGCDMPLSGAAALEALRDELGDSDAVVPRTEGGPEPLHAVYRVEPTLAVARSTLDDGERSLRALLDRLAVEYVESVPTQSLTSVDTRARLDELERAETDAN